MTHRNHPSEEAIALWSKTAQGFKTNDDIVKFVFAKHVFKDMTDAEIWESIKLFNNKL